jgi:hypothetical protein
MSVFKFAKRRIEPSDEITVPYSGDYFKKSETVVDAEHARSSAGMYGHHPLSKGNPSQRSSGGLSVRNQTACIKLTSFTCHCMLPFKDTNARIAHYAERIYLYMDVDVSRIVVNRRWLEKNFHLDGL